MSDDAYPLTLSVPEAGRRYFDLSRNAAYAAAQAGTIPTIKIGKLLRVPVRALEQMLDAATGASPKHGSKAAAAPSRRTARRVTRVEAR